FLWKRKIILRSPAYKIGRIWEQFCSTPLQKPQLSEQQCERSHCRNAASNRGGMCLGERLSAPMRLMASKLCSSIERRSLLGLRVTHCYKSSATKTTTIICFP